MDLSNISKEELLAELESRSVIPEKTDTDLVVGTICYYPEGPVVEVFQKVKTAEDLPSNTVFLRARINGHRHYKMFYFKTDRFDELNNRLNADHIGFSKWVDESKSIKFERM